MTADPFILAGKHYRSRLLVGTGKYRDMSQTKAVVEASGAEIVTVALRRTDLSQTGAGTIQDILPPDYYTYLPNSAGCHTAEDALRTLRLARELGEWNLVKLEVIKENNNLLPDVKQTIEAAKHLVSDGFHVMAYTTDDLDAAKELEAIGCVAVMPLASPIGSGLGIKHPDRIRQIVEQLRVPVLVDAGIGTASDACIAMELGCDAVLLNSALAYAKDPVLMAHAMKNAVHAGRAAFLAGRMPMRNEAVASSPEKGVIAS